MAGSCLRDGRVMEMLSEHTLEGWAEGYLLTGRHGFFSTYEAFVHVIDSMVNQHAKWLEKCKTEVKWRASVPSLNLLITSTVWRQDHNGFTHQDPGFLDVVTNKSAMVTRIYLPPDANCLLSVADHCLRSVDYVNVIVADKQSAPALHGHGKRRQALHQGYRHLARGQATTREASRTWSWRAPETSRPWKRWRQRRLLREHFPELKVRFVNVVDLFRLKPESEHPHGLTDRDFDSACSPPTSRSSSISTAIPG